MEISGIFVDLLFNKYNYQGRLFPSLGNHEFNVADAFSLKEEKNDFLEKYSKLFDKFNVFQTQKEKFDFLHYGYYSSLFKEGLRIISLNSMLCDTMNFYLISNPTDAGYQIKFLIEELTLAEQNKEKVFIIGHIPIGHSTFTVECNKRVLAVLDRFSSIIESTFFGHTHNSGFKLISEYFNKFQPLTLSFTAPSLTTYSNKDPKFRVYEIKEDSYKVKDYEDFYLNLEKANLLSENEKPEFELKEKGTNV